VLCAARWKYRTQKSLQKSPSRSLKWLLHDYDLAVGGLCRLECDADQVKSVYMSASTLKMHRATEACSQFLADNLTLQNCLSELHCS